MYKVTASLARKAIPRSVTPVRIERDVGPLLIPLYLSR